MDVAFAILYLTNDILLYHSVLLPYSLPRSLLIFVHVSQEAAICY